MVQQYSIIKLISALITLLQLVVAIAAEDASQLLTRVEKELAKDLQAIELEWIETSDHYEASHFINWMAVDSAPVNTSNQQLLQEIQLQAANSWGLGISAAYNQRFGNAFDELEDPLAEGNYRVGMDWNILKNGLIDHQQQAKETNYALEKEVLMHTKRARQEMYYLRFNQIQYVFNESLIKLYQTLQPLFKTRVRALQQLRNESYGLPVEYNKSLLDTVQVAQNIKRLQHYNQLIQAWLIQSEQSLPLRADSLPIYTIHIERLSELIREDSTHQQLKGITAQQNKLAYNRLRDISLKVNMSQHYQVSQYQTTNQYKSLNISAKVPVTFKSNKCEKQAKLQQALSTIDWEENNNKKEIINSVYEYEYKLKQYIAWQGKRSIIAQQLNLHAEEQAIELMPISLLKKAQLMEDYISLSIELVDIKKRMYIELLKVYSKLNVDDRAFEDVLDIM